MLALNLKIGISRLLVSANFLKALGNAFLG